MGLKSVRCLPGIGPVMGRRLQDKNFGQADMVLGQFLTMGKDHDKFGQWLAETCQANARHQRLCSNALQDWCNHHL